MTSPWFVAGIVLTCLLLALSHYFSWPQTLPLAVSFPIGQAAILAGQLVWLASVQAWQTAVVVALITAVATANALVFHNPDAPRLAFYTLATACLLTLLAIWLGPAGEWHTWAGLAAIVAAGGIVTTLAWGYDATRKSRGLQKTLNEIETPNGSHNRL